MSKIKKAGTGVDMKKATKDLRYTEIRVHGYSVAIEIAAML